jgi:hypothetical protein
MPTRTGTAATGKYLALSVVALTRKDAAKVPTGARIGFKLREARLIGKGLRRAAHWRERHLRRL